MLSHLGKREYVQHPCLKKIRKDYNDEDDSLQTEVRHKELHRTLMLGGPVESNPSYVLLSSLARDAGSSCQGHKKDQIVEI